MTHPLYQIYSEWLKARYGTKVYKLPVSLPVSCPNRDGTAGTGGCIYCGAKGGGNEGLSSALSVSTQIQRNRDYIAKRYKAQKFIPYFQSFSNTYCSLEFLKTAVYEAAPEADETIVGIAISTRPDCISDAQIAFLSEFQAQRGIDITIELGLQSANDTTLKILNRGHTLADYQTAARRIKSAGLMLCTHVILDLPWDSREDVVQTARVISKADSDFAKCHALYVEKGTVLAKWYENGQIALFPKEEYIRRCILFLTHLRPDMVLQRIIGRAPEEDTIVTNWNTSWWKIRDMLENTMDMEGAYQGQYYQESTE